MTGSDSNNSGAGGQRPRQGSEPLLTIEEGVAVAQALDGGRDAIIECITGCMEGQGATAPESLSQSLGEQGQNRWREDLHYHLDHLAGSAIAGESTLFARYVTWLDQVLSARGESADGLRRSLRALRQCLHRELATEQLSATQTIIDHGLTTLTGSSVAIRGLGGTSDLLAYHPWTDKLVASALDDQRAYAYRLMKRVSRQEGYVSMAVRLVQPALYRLGRAWQTNRISVADDGQAREMVMGLLTRLFGEAAPPATTNDRKALLACVPSNQHSFGVHLVADAFELDGWQVECLGAATSSEHLVADIQRSQPDLVGLSVAMIAQLPELKQQVDAIKAAFGSARPTLIGGGAGLNAVPQLAERLGLDGWYADPREAAASV